MSEIEIKQMQEKINAGILLARKRLIEKTKKEDGELVVVRDGEIVRVKAKDLELPGGKGPHVPCAGSDGRGSGAVPAGIRPDVRLQARFGGGPFRVGE